MKTLTAFNDTAIDNANTEPIRLLTIALKAKDWNASDLTLYLCDRDFGDAGSEMEFDSNQFEPLVLKWGSLKSWEIDPDDYKTSPGEMSVTIDDTVPVGGYDSFAEIS